MQRNELHFARDTRRSASKPHDAHSYRSCNSLQVVPCLTLCWKSSMSRTDVQEIFCYQREPCFWHSRCDRRTFGQQLLYILRHHTFSKVWILLSSPPLQITSATARRSHLHHFEVRQTIPEGAWTSLPSSWIFRLGANSVTAFAVPRSVLQRTRSGRIRRYLAKLLETSAVSPSQTLFIELTLALWSLYLGQAKSDCFALINKWSNKETRNQ